MPQLDAALLAFCKLVGLMEESGSIHWSWLGDPLKNMLIGIPENREALGLLMRALLDQSDDSTKYFDSAMTGEWEPIKPIEDVDGGVGFIWNSDKQQPLRLGFGANVSVAGPGGQKLDFNVLARMLKLDLLGVASSEFGQLSFAASAPVPSFLKTITVGGEYSSKLKLDVTVTNPASVSKTLSLPSSTAVAWDCVRLATFVVRSWVAARSLANHQDKDFFYRMDQHLFPMLGDPAGSIQPMPPLDATGVVPDFSKWKKSVFSTNDGGAGALTFLWHLRALITGNEDVNAFGGSTYFPLLYQGGAPSTFPTVPPGSFATTGTFAQATNVASAWLAFRPDLLNATVELALIFRPASPAAMVEILLAKFSKAGLDGGTLSRPVCSPGTVAALSGVINTLSLTYGSNTIKATPFGGGLKIDVFAPPSVVDSAAAAFNGLYSFGFFLKDGDPIKYAFTSPLGGITLPVDDAKTTAADLVESLLKWIFLSVASQSTLALSANELIGFVKNSVLGAPPEMDKLFSAVAGMLGDAAKIQLGEMFTLEVAPGGTVKPTLSIGPLAPDALKDEGVSIGKLSFGSTLALSNLADPISGFSLLIVDLRLGKASGLGGSGLVAALFPDLREVPGFSLNISYKRGDSFPSITGGGKIPIQRSIGPLEIVALLVELKSASLTLGVDLFFTLGPIQIVVYELGIVISYAKGVAPKIFLHGLGLSFDGGGIKLTGLFLEQGAGDYIGLASVSVLKLFQLSAIGGYAKDPSGDASLFIFASLVAPLGGPPWFFITGIAGGFGFNRHLPSPELLGDHPFLQVMRGQIKFDAKDPKNSLANLGDAFAVQHNQNWIAAGIQFTCFAMIAGKVIVSVSFGKSFSFNLLGMLSYGIQPVAYFELDFLMSADEEHFLLLAGLSADSYLLDPEIFSLQGQFCLGVWYAAPHPGDFVVSIGGYHPFFSKPEHYPGLTRVGVKAKIYNFIHVDVQCFFACTPQALMAGASVSLYAKFAGIAAGLDVYVDVLIQWDPFYIQARIAVTVWFEFMGRHEIGVDLQIHTPPFGGIATIHLFFVSFDLSFGDNLSKKPAPPLFEFITSQLGVPATVYKNKGATMAALNTASSAGLIHVDVTEGRTNQPAENAKEQEGTVSPITVNSEFRFTVRTKLPIGEIGADSSMMIPSLLSGFTNLPLCNLVEKAGTFTVKGPNIGLAIQKRLIDFFPAATFGTKLDGAEENGSARDAIASIDTDKPSVPLSDGIEISYRATEDPINAGYLNASSTEEYSSALDAYGKAPGEEFPLPLAWVKPATQTFRATKNTIRFSALPLKTKISPAIPHQSSREMATSRNAQRVSPPWQVFLSTATILQTTVQIHPRNLTVAAIPAGATLVGLPSSPLRRAELFSVRLAISPIRSATVPRITVVPKLTKAANRTRVMKRLGTVPSRTSANQPVVVSRSVTGAPITPSDLTILPKQAGHIAIAGGSSGATHHFTVDGAAAIRMVFFGAGEDLLEDRYLQGSQSAASPSGTRQILLLHQGTLPITLSATQDITENIGIEADTLLTTLSARAFAGHGCVLQTSIPLASVPALFDTLSGARVLREVSHFTVSFPAVQKAATLILVVEPVNATPGIALDQVRWAALNATLTGFSTVVGPTRTAFLSTVDGVRPWQLDVDLGLDWRVASVVVTAGSSREMSDQMRQSPMWSFIDDRIQTGREATPVNVSFEVAR